MNDRFFAMQLFSRVAHTGSFSLAGREIGLSQPSASRIVAALEKRVGTPLLHRTTRGVKLTEAGSEYLARVEEILAALEEADHAARGTGEFQGTLRVACSSTFATRSLLPILAKFTAPHPRLKVEFLVSDYRQDVVAEGIDVAFRMGGTINPDAIARTIGTNRRLLVAAPSYLATNGVPEVPKDLEGHVLIVGPAGHSAEAWTLRRGSEEVVVRAEGRYFLDGTEAATGACVHGLGIVSTGLFACGAELERGSLVQVLKDWEMGSVDIRLFFPAGRRAKPSARAFADFISAEFGNRPVA